MNTIFVSGKEILLDSSDHISEHTLRRAFLLENEVPIGMSMMVGERNIYLNCEESVKGHFYFVLPKERKNMEFRLTWNDQRRSRPTTPIISLQQEFSGRVTSEEEKEEKNKLFEQYSGFVWELDAFGFVGCVTIVNKTQAVTACHIIFPEEVFPMNMDLPLDHPTKFTVFNQKLNVTATVMIVDFDRVLDYAWLSLDPEGDLKEFTECPLMIEFPDRMQEYYCLGYKNHLGNPLDSLGIVKGTIISQPLTFYKGYVLGSPGSYPGFSGCGIFTRSVLLGICISGSESIGDCGCLQNQAFKNRYTNLVRQPSHTHILPMLSIDMAMKSKNIDVGPTIEQYYLTQLSAKKNENMM